MEGLTELPAILLIVIMLVEDALILVRNIIWRSLDAVERPTCFALEEPFPSIRWHTHPPSPPYKSYKYQVLYSCRWQKRSNQNQLELIKDRCQKQKRCQIVANRQTFGYAECSNTEEARMHLWIVYSCDCGKDYTITRKRRCEILTTPRTTRRPRITPTPQTTPTPLTIPTRKTPPTCNPGRRMKMWDVALDSGSINLNCNGGCIFIHKVSEKWVLKGVSLQGMADCSCHAVHPHHLTIVREICQGKQSCRITPTSAQFGVKNQRRHFLFPNLIFFLLSDYLHSHPVLPNCKETMGDLLLQWRAWHKHCQRWSWWIWSQYLLGSAKWQISNYCFTWRWNELS